MTEPKSIRDELAVRINRFFAPYSEALRTKLDHDIGGADEETR